MNDLLRRYGTALTGVFVVLTAFWLLVLVVLPNLYLFENSFRPYLPVAEMGGPKDVYASTTTCRSLATRSDQLFGIAVTIPIRVRSSADDHLLQSS